MTQNSENKQEDTKEETDGGLQNHPDYHLSAPPTRPTPCLQDSGGLQYQEEDPDEAAVYLLDPGLPPRAFPLGLDQLATLEQHHRAVGVGCDVLLYEVPAGGVFYVLPRLLHCPKEERGLREGRAFLFFSQVIFTPSEPGRCPRACLDQKKKMNGWQGDGG